MPITATLGPLLAGADAVRLREELSQAAWIVLVGTADRFLLECLLEVSAPVLVVEPDQELLEQRAEAAAALGLKGMVFLEQVVGATGKDVSWYRYNDARLNGLAPLAALKPKYPNLALESIEIRQQLSLAQLLQAWEPALVDGGVLVLPEQAGSDWLDDAVSCLQRLRALCWQSAEPRNTTPLQHLEAVLADCWLVSAMDDEMSQPLLKVWRRDPALHFQATVLSERDQLLKQVQLLESDQAALVAERDGVMAERDALSSQVAVLQGEKGALIAERDGLIAERVALAVDRDALIVNQQELEGLQAERDDLSSRLLTLTSEFQELAHRHQEVSGQLEALSAQFDGVQQERDSLNAERCELRAERDKLQEEKSRLSTDKQQLRAALEHVFPYELYREKRADLSRHDHSQLIDHFALNGINEGVDLCHVSMKQRLDGCQKENQSLHKEIALIQQELSKAQAHNQEVSTQLETLGAQCDLLHQERDRLSTDRDALAASQQELCSQRDGLQAERGALQGERDDFNAQLQAVTSQYQEQKRERQELSNQLEALSSQRNDTRKELDQALEKIDALQSHVNDLTASLRHVFPVKIYRDNRPEMGAFDDEQLLRHFIENGINESVAHVISGKAMSSAIALLSDKLSLIEANQRLLLKERDELAAGLAAQASTTTIQALEGFHDKSAGASLFSIHLNDLSLVSDKWESYFGHYERHLSPYRARAEEVVLLEVGVQNGGSLEAWKKFLGGQARIVGTDINPATGLLNLPDLVSSFVGDATDAHWARLLCDAHGPFDIVIDDGSHKSVDIIKTFSLFFSSVKPGGLYICEDLHAAYWEKYGGAPPGEGETAIEMFKEIADLVNIEHWSKKTFKPSSQYIPLLSAAMSNAESLSISDLIAIESVEFCNSLVLIRKKQSGPCSLGRRVVSCGEAAVEPRVLGVDGTRGGDM